MARRLMVMAALLSLAAHTGRAPGALAAQGPAGQPRRLFNGKDLTGWDGDPRFWSVKEGAITGTTTADNPTQRNTFLIWKGGPVKDFELRAKFRIQGGNSGIQYRSKDLGEWRV